MGNQNVAIRLDEGRRRAWREHAERVGKPVSVIVRELMDREIGYEEEVVEAGVKEGGDALVVGGRHKEAAVPSVGVEVRADLSGGVGGKDSGGAEKVGGGILKCAHCKRCERTGANVNKGLCTCEEQT
mgnify:CR=1 FL=1